jgi:hypothetical protein
VRTGPYSCKLFKMCPAYPDCGSLVGLTIPGFRSFISGIQIPVLIQTYRFFGTNLKHNCLWFIHIKVIKSTTIKH